MSWLTDKFLCDVTVLVANLQSAKSKRQSQLADDKANDYQFSLGSVGTKEGRKENEKFRKDQLTTSKNSIKISRTHRKSFFNNYPLPSN